MLIYSNYTVVGNDNDMYKNAPSDSAPSGTTAVSHPPAPLTPTPGNSPSGENENGLFF